MPKRPDSAYIVPLAMPIDRQDLCRKQLVDALDETGRVGEFAAVDQQCLVEQQVRELKETVLATQATIAKAQATVSKTIDGAQAVLAPEDSVK